MWLDDASCIYAIDREFEAKVKDKLRIAQKEQVEQTKMYASQVGGLSKVYDIHRKQIRKDV